jgi:hypothetical protein
MTIGQLAAVLMTVGAGFVGPPSLSPPREHPDNPPAPPRPVLVSVPAVSGFTRTGFRSVQVNVNAQGMNIIGDAANEPSIASDPAAPGHIAIGWRQFDSITSNFRQAGVAFSRDFGQTWTASTLDPGIFRSDPVLRAGPVPGGAPATPNAIFYYSLTVDDSGSYSCQLFKSLTGGMTWSAPLPAFGGDKAWTAVDRTFGPGRGNFYAAWDLASCCGPSTFTRSPDAGATFLTPIPIASRPEWGTAAVGLDGAYYLGGNLSGDLTRFSVVRSSNAQNNAGTPTWDLTQTVSLGGSQRYLVNGSPNPGGLLGQVWLGVDRSPVGSPTRGNVYLLCSVRRTTGTDPLDVMFARSTDGGSTWSTPVKVNDEAAGTNAYQWFGTMGVAPNGRIDVVWNDTQGTGSPTRSALRYSYSTNAGQTWAPSVAISSVFDSTIGWPNQNKIGDYSDIESDATGANLAYAATFNGEEDVYYLRIGPFPCPADVDADGSVSVADFLAFLQLFASGSAQADFNGDGQVNVADFLAFLSAYAAGCP